MNDSPSDAKEYTSFGSAIDLVNEGGGKLAQRLKVTTAGTITIVTGNGQTRTLTVTDGETIDMQVSKINSVTSVTRVRAYWR
ncbi:hypothetical protein Rctr16k_23 [Virus Rctr16k]|nr:hypothetical protein Rctr16k_23 [Virus Rctr16k]